MYWMLGGIFSAVLVLVGFKIRNVVRARSARKQAALERRAETDRCYAITDSDVSMQYDCGHMAPTPFKLSIHGRVTGDITYTDRCPDCAIKDAKHGMIRCASCGGPIFPTQPVAVMTIYDSYVQRLDVATHVSDTEVICCIAMDTCDLGPCVSGQWMGDHYESFFESGNGLIEEAIATNKPAIVVVR